MTLSCQQTRKPGFLGPSVCSRGVSTVLAGCDGQEEQAEWDRAEGSSQEG